MIKRLSLLTAGLFCLLGVTLPTALPAHAGLDLVGICQSGTSSCWRVQPGAGSGAPVDLWARDISGDIGQDWSGGYLGPLYDGIADSCDPNHLSWINNYAGDGVYFFGNLGVNGSYNLTSQGNNLQMRNDDNPTDYYWIWTSQGYLINCANSDYWNAAQGITSTFNYDQLITSSSDWAHWQQIDIPTPG